MSISSAAPSSSGSISPVFFHWLAKGLQLTTPLKLYFRSCCLQCLSSLLSNIFRLGASTIFDGRLFHSFTILMLRKFCLGDFSALWWKILKMCPLVGRLVALSCRLGIMLRTVSSYFPVINLYVSIRSPLNLLNCNVGRSSFCKCSS